MKFTTTFLLTGLLAFTTLKAQNAAAGLGYTYTLSKPIDVDLNKNYIFHLGYDGDNRVYAQRFDRSKDEVVEVLQFDTSFNLMNRAPYEQNIKMNGKKMKTNAISVSKYGINHIFSDTDDGKDKLTFFMKTWDNNLKTDNTIIEVGSLPIVKKRYAALQMSGHGSLRVTRSPDNTKTLIAFYNTAPKDDDRSVYYLMVDAATKKGYTKTFKMQEQGSEYPLLHLANAIDNNGTVYIITGDMKDKGMHFLSFIRDDKMADFRNLKFLRHNFLTDESKTIAIGLEDRQYLKFDMSIDKTGDVLAAGMCTKTAKRDHDDAYYVRYNPASEKVVAKNFVRLPCIASYMYASTTFNKPNYMDLLTNGNLSLVFLDNGSCAFFCEDGGGDSRKDKNTPNSGDIVTTKLDVQGNQEWEGRLPYKIIQFENSRGESGRTTLNIRIPISLGNQLAYFYHDEDKNKDIYDPKKLHSFTFNNKSLMLMLLNFDAKGGIKKEEVPLSHNKEKFQLIDFMNWATPSLYYFPLQEGKKAVIGKLSIYAK
jgi:hypothetical protein